VLGPLLAAVPQPELARPERGAGTARRP